MFRDLIGKGIELHNISLQQGYIKADGSMSTSEDTDHSKYVTTDFIQGGRDFLCYLNEHYFVHSVSVYDQNDNLLCQNMYTISARRYKMMQEFSFHLHKYYKVRLGIVRNDSQPTGYLSEAHLVEPEEDLTPSDDIINMFFYLDLQYFYKLSTTDPGYNDAMLRKEHICSMWTDRGSLPCKHPVDQGPTNEFGVLYSDQNFTPGRVGLEVSPWTYITACHNPRSVLHTELVYNQNESPVHQTEYGFDYTPTNTTRCWGWHGASCSNTVCYVLGFDDLPVAANFLTEGTYNTTEIIPEDDCSNLHVFDMIVSSKHIWVITDIFKDANGNVRFIETTESGGGTLTTAITMYSPEGFLSRVRNEQSGDGYHIQRLPGNIPNKAPTVAFDYMPNNLTNEFTPVTLNDDICTFIGDKASFMWGGIIYLNAQRQKGWENIEIEKWNSTNEQYEHFQNIDISAGDTYPTKDTNGDWIDINLSSYYPYMGNEYGKYKAYCTGLNGHNIWDKTKPWLIDTTNNKMFWLDANNSCIKQNSTAGYESHIFAYACKPNTTYVATIPSATYYDSPLLRMGWNTGDLSFVDNYTEPVPLNGVAQGTVLSDNKIVTTITTGADATYLFLYIADPAAKAQKAINTLTLKEKAALVTSSSTVLQSQDEHSYYLNQADMLVKRYNSTSWCPVYAIPCEPNTTYVATIPSQTAYGSTILRFAWGTMSDLSFAQNNTSASIEEIVNGVQTGDVLTTTITTGSDATYLFLQLSEVQTKWQYAINNLTLSPVYKSEPTYYEVLATASESTVTNGIATYNFKDFYGTTTYFCFENGNGFCNSSLSPTYRYQHPTDAVRLAHVSSSWVALPSSYHKYWATRTRGEYGCAKKREQYTTPINYYDSTYWTANKNIDSTTGVLIDDNYRNVVTIDNVSEGDIYYFITKRVLSAGYNNERYAFYDSNDQMVGDIQWFYNPNDPVYIDPPAVGTLSRWTITVPAGVTKIKIAVLIGNSNQQIWKPNTYFPPES